MKTLHISIPKPCSENWDEMTPAEKGRFCAACQKTVIDFTQKTPAEIVAILRNSQEKLCGHFRKDQLGFYHLPEVPEPALLSLRHSFSWQKWAAMLSALVVWQGTPAFSQNADSLNRVQVEQKKDQETGKKEWIVKGRVVGEDGSNLVVSINVENNDCSLYTIIDENGYFSLNLSSMNAKKVTLKIEANGFYYDKKVKVKFGESDIGEIKLKQTKQEKTNIINNIDDTNVRLTGVMVVDSLLKKTMEFRVNFVRLDDRLKEDSMFHLQELFYTFIEFETGTAKIKKESFEELDIWAKLLQEKTSLVIEVQSHTDCTLSVAEGQTLSEKRAKVIVDYFIGKGVLHTRLLSTGYSNSKPIPQMRGRKQERITFNLINREY